MPHQSQWGETAGIHLATVAIQLIPGYIFDDNNLRSLAWHDHLILKNQQTRKSCLLNTNRWWFGERWRCEKNVREWFSNGYYAWWFMF
jgi:hypothetical protein